MPETVPARRALIGDEPHRHHEVAPDQHAVQGLAGGDQRSAVFGEHQGLDQVVDGRIADPHIIAAAVALGRLAAPEIALLIAG
jgi:hypothetical protein